jgi:hypothetical protein
MDDGEVTRLTLGEFRADDCDLESGSVVEVNLLGDGPERFWSWVQAGCAVPPCSGLLEIAGAIELVVDKLWVTVAHPDDRDKWMGLLGRIVAAQMLLSKIDQIPESWRSDLLAAMKLAADGIEHLIRSLRNASSKGQELDIVVAIKYLTCAAAHARRMGECADRHIIKGVMRSYRQPAEWNRLSFGIASSTYNEPQVLAAICLALDSLQLDPFTLELGTVGDAVVAVRGCVL